MRLEEKKQKTTCKQTWPLRPVEHEQLKGDVFMCIEMPFSNLLLPYQAVS